jgi:hypothetical protein
VRRLEKEINRVIPERVTEAEQLGEDYNTNAWDQQMWS